MSKIPQGEWNAIAARYQNGESISRIARSYGCTPPAIHYILKRNRQRPVQDLPEPSPPRLAEPAAPGLVRMTPREPPQPAKPPPEPPPAIGINGGGGPQLVRLKPAAPAADMRPADIRPAAAPLFATGQPVIAEQPSAPPVPGLDDELHTRAEAAIALFRSSFDAALAEGSPAVCDRLRQAATDLMRVAARTTIVLDRLSAIAERSSRAHNYPRSAYTADDFGKIG